MNIRSNITFLYIFTIIAVLLAIITLTGKSTTTPPSVTQEVKKTLDCSGIPTPQQAEGPYYKTRSQERNNIAQNLAGEKIVITGFVFDKNCKAIPGAWLDFWHADSSGKYDNSGFNLRGHQYTNKDGGYVLETIVPAAYETRPPHIHVKVKAPDGPILTSQMYFPNENLNREDPIFNPALIMEVIETADGKTGTFNFVLP